MTDASTKNYFNEIVHTLKFNSLQFDSGSPFADASSDPSVLQNPVEHLVFSLVPLENFKSDPKWMKTVISDPSISEKELSEAFEKLILEKRVEQRGGKFVITGEINNSPDSYRPETFKIYRVGLKEIDHALDHVVLFKPCNFFMGHFTVDVQGRAEIMKIFNRCREEIMEIEGKCKNPTEVIAISNNFITIAKTASSPSG